jgi:hypothetical protein
MLTLSFCGITPFNSPMNPNNSNLEKTLSVATILKDLKLFKYMGIFIREEVIFTNELFPY